MILRPSFACSSFSLSPLSLSISRSLSLCYSFLVFLALDTGTKDFYLICARCKSSTGLKCRCPRLKGRGTSKCTQGKIVSRLSPALGSRRLSALAGSRLSPAIGSCTRPSFHMYIKQRLLDVLHPNLLNGRKHSALSFSWHLGLGLQMRALAFSWHLGLGLQMPSSMSLQKDLSMHLSCGRHESYEPHNWRYEPHNWRRRYEPHNWR